MLVSRRGFLSSGGIAVAGASLVSFAMSGHVEAQRKPAIPSEQVKEFVGKAHSDLGRIKELIAENPKIVNATWGCGDYETALCAASHMGRSDIADYLLQNKARKDIFCSAMKGEAAILAASLAADGSVAVRRGPHGITLLFHAGLGGNVEIAKMLKKNGAHDDRALHAAVWYGHRDMAEWLINHDTKNVNAKWRKMTAHDLAIKEGHADIAEMLRERGVKTTKV